MANEHENVPEELAEPEAEATPEETPVSQPEAEPGEDADETPQPEPDAPDVEEAEGEAVCPVKMGLSSGPRCGHKLHAAPDGVDEQPVCLMHSKDPNKQSGPLCKAFWLEFRNILENAGEIIADFKGFFFPNTDLIGEEFKAICQFDEATFMQDADFSGVTFTRSVDFRGATFTQNAIFSGTTFTQNADFSGATFTQNTNFYKSTFKQTTYFIGAIFKHDTDFSRVIFTLEADFNEATFTQKVDFREATFIQDANFRGAAFTQNADFLGATFTQNVDFIATTFTQSAFFWHATFMVKAIFSGATFKRIAGFTQAKFYGTTDWRECRFLDQAEFRHTEFLPKEPKTPSAVFSLAKFAKPDEIVFENVDLSRALFLNCDVSAVWFTSSVWWARRKGQRGFAVFEEKILLDPVLSKEIELFGMIDHGAVEQIYHQLQKNYDARLDYRMANNFHYGEMEMRRLEPPADGPFIDLRWILPRWMNLLTLYRLASNYGNSYAKPGAWLLATLLAATLLFPVLGLEQKQPKPGNPAGNAIVTYSSVWNRQDTDTNNRWTEAKLIGKSGITAIDTATFQRNPEYTPVYPRGRILGIIETLLTSSLFALFLLAIRRQFRR
jgi:uncharacterized protein YjbI with pentapeptide repeats